MPLPRPPMLANDQRRWTWPQVRAAKQQVGEIVYLLAKRARLKELKPARVSFHWFAPDKRKRDSDSLGPFVKGALDGMVKAGAWPSDDSDWVTEVAMSVDKTQTRNPRIEIRIFEHAGSELAATC